MFVVVFYKVLPLLLVIGLGYLAGALRAFPDPTVAIETLNRYALYFGFPLLIFRGFCQPEWALSTHPGFYLLHLLIAAVVIGGVGLFGQLSTSIASIRGSLVLGSLFGNVAYLGLPLGTQLLGQESLGLLSSSVAMQVFLAMALGPLFLLVWQAPSQEANAPSRRELLSKLLWQPLLWAPVLGLLVRLSLPKQALLGIATQLKFFAVSAAPVALFLLGLHIWVHQRSLRKLDLPVLWLLLAKLVWVPLCVLGLGGVCVRWGWVSVKEWQVLLVLSTMPTAITTFSIARDMGVSEGRMAQAILLSTLISLVLLPLVAPWVLSL